MTLQLSPLRRLLLVLLLGAAPVMAIHAAAHAQGVDPSDEREAKDQAEAAQRKADERAKAPPPAIPGAVSDEETSTSAHSGADLEPTAALFDSINRGSLTGAKEALNRGADIQGKNELGMSPLDMSIDLSRNDITFLLLSMRNSDSSQNAPVVASAAGTAGGSDGKDDAGRKNKHRRRGHDSELADAGTPAKPARSVRVASDGGTPKPEIGFLGFNGS
ncbi:ankyrin repeat domain-containing protein [Rhizosaccharibacter radicis]|uniref:Ankyrin repeat domain-containing protein n=1 Tax=Rhizosaccharibacter radicis TaxID=2782605 RepID=A0ABT1VXF4_9PROT|nr:ankyrin repeat domain-containing protein [Acetobacteraceae bacterium KSS12]